MNNSCQLNHPAKRPWHLGHFLSVNLEIFGAIDIAASVRVLLTLGAICALTSVGEAATIRATSCSRSDVGTAVQSSTYGDIVEVPAGTCIWSTTLTITRDIRLRGAGTGVTVIVSDVTSSGYILAYRPDSTSLSRNQRFDISGFTWDMNDSSGGLLVTHSSRTQAITKLQIYENEFKNVPGSGSSLDAPCIRVGGPGQAYGVIHKNTFTNCKSVGNNYGSQQHRRPPALSSGRL